MRPTSVSVNLTLTTRNITGGTPQLVQDGSYVVTFRHASATPFKAGDQVLVAGATPGALNGQYTVIQSSDTVTVLQYPTNPGAWSSGGTLSNSGFSAAIIPDYIGEYAPVGLMAEITGTVTYTIEYTMDDPFQPGWQQSSAPWFPVSAALQAKTANAADTTNQMVRAIRINGTTGTAGTVTLVAVQGTPS